MCVSVCMGACVHVQRWLEQDGETHTHQVMHQRVGQLDDATRYTPTMKGGYPDLRITNHR